MTQSLYLRLNLAAILVLVCFLTGIGVVLDNAHAKNLKLSLRETTLSQLYNLAGSANIDGEGRLIMPLPLHLPEPELALPGSGLYAFVTGKDFVNVNSAVWRSPSFGNRPLPKVSHLTTGQKDWREINLPGCDPCALIGIGYQRMVKSGVAVFNFYLLADLAPVNRQIQSYRHRLWGGLLATALLLLLVQIAVSRWALNPLKAVNRELKAIEMGKSRHLEGNYPREITQLTQNINNMLSRERERQQRYRNALDDLAHSLKTPLAVLLAAKDDPAELPNVVAEQSARMKLIVERQLQRAGNAANLTSTPAINLLTTVKRIFAPLAKIYQEKDIEFINLITPEQMVFCEETDLLEILGNIIDNAFKWCRSRIEIRAVPTSAQLCISIDDDGPGIESGDIDHILRRGGRADETMPGSGIGLSLAVDLIEAYQGRLRIEPGRLGGAMVTIELKTPANR